MAYPVHYGLLYALHFFHITTKHLKMKLIKSLATTTILFIVMLITNGSAFGQTGRVGINTTTPAAMLHVKDSSAVFTAGAVNSGGAPVNGAGMRMMWYASRG